MPVKVIVQVSPEVANDSNALISIASSQGGIKRSSITHVQIAKRSIDARQKRIKINLTLDVYVDEKFEEAVYSLPNYKNVANEEEVHIVGAGPAGLFAALKCIELGKKPVVYERGKDVKARRRDLKALNQDHIVDENSNYCFGEGGAGTYSDGKLYTRSKKRGDVQRILELLVGFGATNEILIEAHPHIGTNKLPQIIEEMRACIIKFGGEVHFNQLVTDLSFNDGMKSITVNDANIKVKKLILATGHSARDVFELLHKKGVAMEAKPFAVGVRVEHSQALIDKIRYSCETRGEFLPPAPYNISKQINKRGVYSFCMCPGGVIAPCATAQGEVVTNGWSPSKRDLPNANSGVVVALNLEDFKPFADKGPLAGMYFQKAIEQKAWEAAGKTQRVPAQLLVDFMNNKQSPVLKETSYQPGLTSVNLSEIFPAFVTASLRKGLRLFEKQMNGYLTNEAVVHAPETRTSSPVRIPRDRETLQHPQIKGFFPCGEGAGYAGGIMSAAIDGENCAIAACK